MAVTSYGELETALAEKIINSVETMLNAYLGNDSISSEIVTRGLGIYEKKTFKTLLGYYIENLIYEQNTELTKWGHSPLTDTQYKNIAILVNKNSDNWVKRYDSWKINNPNVVINDFQARRSKVLPYTTMSQPTWQSTKKTIETERNKLLQNEYKDKTIYDFASLNERLELEEKYPDKQFVGLSEFQSKLRDNVMTALGTTTTDTLSEQMINSYVAWDSAIQENQQSESIKYNDLTGQQLQTVKNHHEQFIEYTALQVFGDGYPSQRQENISKSIANSMQPSLSDFQSFMNIRAMSDARSGEYGFEGTSQREYSSKDADIVASLNQRFVNDRVLSRYEDVLNTNGLFDDTDSITNSAFGYDIPSATVLTSVQAQTSNIAKDTWANLGSNGATDNETKQYITNAIQDLAKENNVDSTFLEPYVNATENKYDKDKATYEKYKDAAGTVSKVAVKALQLATQLANSTADTTNVSIPNGSSKSKAYNENTTINSSSGKTAKDLYRESLIAASSKTSKPKATTASKKKIQLNGTVTSQFAPTYKTFSGHDMVVIVEVPITNASSITKVIGAFQTVTYSIHNEKTPVRVLGDMNVHRYVFGPRTIAGSLELIVFDRHWMRELINMYKTIKSDTERYFLMDELPALNITISYANEYGHSAKLALYGVTIVNEGQIMSINDIYTENTYEFFATGIDYLDKVEKTYNTSGKKSTSNNLPVVELTPKVTDNKTVTSSSQSDNNSGSDGSSTGTETTTADPTANKDNVSNGIISKLNSYDTTRVAKLKELDDAVKTYEIKKAENPSPELDEEIANYITNWERSENVRRTTLYKEQVKPVLLEELEKEYKAKKITEEEYNYRKKTINDATSILNDCPIIKDNAVIADRYRIRCSVRNSFPSTEETLDKMNAEKGKSASESGSVKPTTSDPYLPPAI